MSFSEKDKQFKNSVHNPLRNPEDENAPIDFDLLPPEGQESDTTKPEPGTQADGSGEDTPPKPPTGEGRPDEPGDHDEGKVARNGLVTWFLTKRLERNRKVAEKIRA